MTCYASSSKRAISGKRLTVAICTRNRESFLRSCLDGLLAAITDDECDLIVIDNSSTDGTQRLLDSYSDLIQIYLEPRIGLSHARNRAVDVCKTDYIAFLDDDGIPEPSWYTSVCELITTYSPDVFGGPFFPYYLDRRPMWFDDRLGSAHTESEDGLQSVGACFSGGNMGWKTALLRELGGFDPALGMRGDKMLLGEETALQIRIWKENKDAKFAFSKGMSMLHYVSPEKMTLRYIFFRNYTYGFQLRDLDPANQVLKRTSPDLVMSTRFGVPILGRILFRDRKRFPYWKTYVAAYLCLHAISLGILARRFSRP